MRIKVKAIAILGMGVWNICLRSQVVFASSQDEAKRLAKEDPANARFVNREGVYLTADPI